MRGQTLVEFALVMPILMFMLLGFGEAAMLFATRAGYQNGVDVLAQWAASQMAEGLWPVGWSQVVDDEQNRVGCADQPAVTFPDTTNEPGDRVLVRWECVYEPRLTPALGLNIPVRVESEAVVPGVKSSPSPSASP